MFTHDQIWAAIDRLAGAKGLSPSGLARQAGLDPTAFNRSKRISPNGKPRWPSTESLSKILAVTDSDISDLLSLMDLEQKIERSIPILPLSSVRNGKIVPVRGLDRLTIAFKSGDDAFAFIIDDRFDPLFRTGSTIVAEPQVKIKVEDRILAYGRKGGLRAGILKSLQKKTYTILQSAPPGLSEESFSEGDIDWVARILWSSH